MASINLEQGTVAGALDEALVFIQELVFLPFKINACMWATVDESVEFAVFMDNKDIDGFTVVIDLECLTARVRDV